MIETYEYGGLWWLPSEETKKLSGTLTITRGQGELAVLGSFGHDVLDKSEDALVLSPIPRDVPRILGMTTAGREVTLEACTTSNSRQNFPGIPTTTYRARVVLFNAWFTEEEEIVFDEISLRTSDLDTWAYVSGFGQSISDEEHPETGLSVVTAIDIHFEPPPAITIPLDHGEEAKVDFAVRYSGLRPVTTDVNLSHTASFRLRYANPRPLHDALLSVGQLRNFLSLAVGRPQTVLTVKAFKDDFVRPESKTRQPIELLFEIVHNPDPPESPLHPTFMLFTLPEAKPGISEAMRAWFGRQELLRPVFNLYFAMLYHPAMYRDVHFLAYAQAVETYDFRRRNATEIPSDQHEQRIAEILAASPPGHRGWLERKLAYSNELGLRRRVRDVMNECPTVSSKIVGETAADRRAFIAGFVDSRNYYTHYNPDLERRAATGVALALLVVQLRALIEMSLLRELGFSCGDIDSILDRVQRYAAIQNLKAQVGAERPSSGTQRGDTRPES